MKKRDIKIKKNCLHVFRFLSGKNLLFMAMLMTSLITTNIAAEQRLNIELQNANLADAVQMMAKFMNQNVIISHTVIGVATLNLHNVAPAQALNLLLSSHGLASWREENILFIAPRNELIKRKQEELKWQEIWDASSPLITQIWHIKYANALDIAHLLQDEHTSLVSKRGSIRADARSNIIFIHDTPEYVQNVHKIIKNLDVPVAQVMIEARLASIDHDFERELGLHFSSEVKTEDNVKSNGESRDQYSLAIAKLVDGSMLDIRLAALENEGHAELISSPSLFAANQQSAFIESGEEVPYQEASESGGTAVVFKKAVLGLKVTPQILPGKKVLLQLMINQDRPSDKMVLGVPTISTRQIMTNVLAKNGETIVLGGIYETNHENGEKRLPFISKLPLLGKLFTTQNSKEKKRELLIFVRPKIITKAHE